jgi:bifunctional UDP-N-acetylglucosamine pyrophosphorylase / glucosamine-1-phosphate N-acetyltransferase
VITCNYDGHNKYQTIIEDNCFVGCGTQLIAPVTIAESSYIAAGSTIVKDTPAKQLTLSRSEQVSIAGWVSPRDRAKEEKESS